METDSMFRKPTRKEWLYFLIVVLLYVTGAVRVYAHALRWKTATLYNQVTPI